MIKLSNKQTKTICSFTGPLCVGLIDKIDDFAPDAIRLVYEQQYLAEILDFMKKYCTPTNLNQCPIMLDISTWSQAEVLSQDEKLLLNFSDTFTVSEAGKGGQVEISAISWKKLFKKNSVVYFGFGSLVAKINRLEQDVAELEVLQGGWIHRGMDIYVPDTRVQTSLEHIHPEDFSKFNDCPMDYVIIPAQWSAREIKDFRNKINEISGEAAPWIIAKIDSVQTYENLGEYLHLVDGIMISRREMSLTMNPAIVPMVAKEIIQKCNNEAKIVVTASEMFGSMRFNATPTRAEVSDVANAVIDGTDAVILSEEVSAGEYGPKAVQIVNDVIIDIEKQAHVSENWMKIKPAINNEMDAITYGAYQTAQRVDAKAIVCITKHGNTALRLSSYRVPVPVIAVTFSPETRDKLKLVRGVQTLYLDIAPHIDNVLPTVNDFLLKESWLNKGDPIIFVAVTLSSLSEDASNLFTIQNLS